MRWAGAFLALALAALTAAAQSKNYDAGRSVPRWVDAVVPANATKVAGAQDPLFEQIATDGAGSRGLYAYAFPAAATSGQERDLFFSLQMPHGLVTGLSVSPHVHFVPQAGTATTNGATVIFGLEYLILRPHVTAAPVSTVVYLTNTFTVTNWQHYITGFGSVTSTNITDSALVQGRIFRKSGDTYTGKIYILSHDWHCRVQDFGSLLETGDNN